MHRRTALLNLILSAFSAIAMTVPAVKMFLPQGNDKKPDPDIEPVPDAMAFVPEKGPEDLVMVIQGGVLIDQMAVSARPMSGYLQVPPGSLVVEHVNQNMLDKYRESPDVYPRVQQTAVPAQILVGTVDELVEEYRQKLLAAKDSMNSLNAMTGLAQADINNHLLSIRDAYRQEDDEGATHIPWDFKILDELQRKRARIEHERAVWAYRNRPLKTLTLSVGEPTLRVDWNLPQ